MTYEKENFKFDDVDTNPPETVTNFSIASSWSSFLVEPVNKKKT